MTAHTVTIGATAIGVGIFLGLYAHWSLIVVMSVAACVLGAVWSGQS
ncbi:hypothetical protein [Actinokineospora inagensis]|nr:hypothetical protein [Actinokineospora inagensis]